MSSSDSVYGHALDYQKMFPFSKFDGGAPKVNQHSAPYESYRSTYPTEAFHDPT